MLHKQHKICIKSASFHRSITPAAQVNGPRCPACCCSGCTRPCGRPAAAGHRKLPAASRQPPQPAASDRRWKRPPTAVGSNRLRRRQPAAGRRHGALKAAAAAQAAAWLPSNVAAATCLHCSCCPRPQWRTRCSAAAGEEAKQAAKESQTTKTCCQLLYREGTPLSPPTFCADEFLQANCIVHFPL